MKPDDFRPRTLVRRGRLLAQRVNASVDIRVHRAIIVVHRIEHLDRLLRRRRVVQVDQRLALDLPVENGEVGADALDVDTE